MAWNKAVYSLKRFFLVEDLTTHLSLLFIVLQGDGPTKQLHQHDPSNLLANTEDFFFLACFKNVFISSRLIFCVRVGQGLFTDIGKI